MTLTTLLRSSLSKNITAYQTGRGPSMVLIHGVGMNADYWGNISADLAKHFTLTIVDLPGHGQSTRLKTTQPELSNYTDVMAAVLPEKSIIVGHSMGALIALDLAVRFTEKVTGLAVLNGIYRRTETAQRAIQQRASELDSGTTQDPTKTLKRWFGDQPEGTNAIAADHCRHWLNNVSHAAYSAAYRAFAEADAPTDKQLQSIKTPALFMTGAKEPNSTPDMSAAMSALVPDSRCTVIQNARHMMSLTHGSEVSHHIINFFNGT